MSPTSSASMTGQHRGGIEVRHVNGGDLWAVEGAFGAHLLEVQAKMRSIFLATSNKSKGSSLAGYGDVSKKCDGGGSCCRHSTTAFLDCRMVACSTVSAASCASSTDANVCYRVSSMRKRPPAPADWTWCNQGYSPRPISRHQAIIKRAQSFLFGWPCVLGRDTSCNICCKSLILLRNSNTSNCFALTSSLCLQICIVVHFVRNGSQVAVSEQQSVVSPPV